LGCKHALVLKKVRRLKKGGKDSIVFPYEDINNGWGGFYRL